MYRIKNIFLKPLQPKQPFGSTLLHAACYRGHLHIVTYLISHGGNYYILNNADETPVENGKI
jgi:ankyrin repeat protein